MAFLRFSVNRALSLLNSPIKYSGKNETLLSLSYSSPHSPQQQSKRPYANMTSDQEINIQLVQKVFDFVIKEGLISGNFDVNKKVVDFVHPDQVGEKLGGLEISEVGLKDVEPLIEAVAKYSVKTCHSRFFNQLYHGSDAAGLAGQASIYECLSYSTVVFLKTTSSTQWGVLLSRCSFLGIPV